MITIKKVLLVASFPDQAKKLSDLMRVAFGDDLTIVNAESANEALRHTNQDHFDCILIHYDLSDIDGVQLLGILSQKQILHYCPGILFINSDSAAIEHEALQKGASSCLVIDDLDSGSLRRTLRYAFTGHQQLKHLKQMYFKQKTILDNTNEGIVIIDARGVIVYANQTSLKLLKYKKTELLGKYIQEILLPKIQVGNSEVEPESQQKIIEYAQKKLGVQKQARSAIVTKGGEQIPTHYMASLLYDFDDQITGVVINFQDISSHLKVKEQVVYQACYDRLTGLPNRFLFDEVLRHTITIADRNELKFALLFLDLDDFKTINDTLGHISGDLLIRDVSNRLSKLLRASDFIARQGGDEFIIILEGAKDEVRSEVVSKKINEILSMPFMIEGNEVKIHASIGIAIYPDSGNTAESLIKNADAAMYYAKDHGKNRYQVYSDTIAVEKSQYAILEADLEHAVERNELFLNFQPQIDIKNGKLVGFEVLCRWNHPKQGVISPNIFIELAEASGYIYDIGDWVLRAACLQFKLWQRKKLLDDDVLMAVNLSAKQLAQTDLVEHIQGILTEYSMKPYSLELEVTETAVMENIVLSASILEKLSKLGLRIAVDDFGTSYSSLQYLKRLPVQCLKIDKSFVQDLTVDLSDAAIVKAIIQLAHTMNLGVTAEGVETIEQLEFLSKHQCNYAQGFYFSKPLGVDEMEAFIASFQDKKASG